MWKRIALLLATGALIVCLSGFNRTIHSADGDFTESQFRLEVRVLLARAQMRNDLATFCRGATASVDDQIAALRKGDPTDTAMFDPASFRLFVEIWQDECRHLPEFR